MSSIVSYKCPHCGGGLNFTPGVGFKCEYCLSVMSQEELDAFYAAQAPAAEAENAAEATENAAPDGEKETTEAAGGAPASASPSAQTEPSAQSQKPDGTDVQEGDAALYVCPSCGAQIIAEATTAATMCHYCHNPVVLSENLAGKFNPDWVIPFSVNKEQAAAKFKEHCSGRFFLPKDFYCENSIENLYGVYYPYWIVDSVVAGTYSARGNKLVTSRAGNDLRKEITVYDIRRSGSVHLNNITNSALKKADQTILRYILPFQPEGFINFSMAYLSGFRAEKRDIEKEELSKTVDQQKLAYTKQLLEQTVSGYSSVENGRTGMDTVTEDWRYALLPVWILVYKYKDETYTYGINGQTGKSYGGLPVDKTKLTITSILVGLLVALFFFFML